MASFWVAQELLAHIADQRDPDFKYAHAAIKKLVLHCTQYDGRRSLVRFIGDGFGTISRELFDRPVPGDNGSAEDYGTLLGVVASARTPEDWKPYQAALDEIKTTVGEQKRDFVRAMWGALIHPHLPDATSWDAISRNKELSGHARLYFDSVEAHRVPAIALVDDTARRCGITLSAEERDGAIDLALSLFPTPVQLTYMIARKVALEGWNLSRRQNANSITDVRLCYSTSCNGAIGGVPIWLLSDDQLLLGAARASNSERVFRKFSTFQALLAQSTEAVIEEIEHRR